jgi:hypothetical protein
VFFSKKTVISSRSSGVVHCFLKNGGGVLSSTEMKKNKKDFFASY